MTTFAGRVRSGQQLLGALVRMPNEGLVELAGLTGLDFVVLDTEHGPGDQLALGHHLTAATAAGLSSIVRVGSATQALRALDLGAHGILAPHVDDAAQAAELAAEIHYPPAGRRGFAGYTRAARYGLVTAGEHYDAGAQSLLIAMIEDDAGLGAAAQIAGVAGVDGLMFGPADYACSIGALEAPDDPRIAAAASAVREQARAAGRVSMSIVGSRAAARRAFAEGHTLVVHNVQQALTRMFVDLAGARPPAPARPAGREPLVLVPGMLGDPGVWAGVATELQDLIAPQFARIDLDDTVAEMAESLLATAPARFALAGHSLGAIVALEVARRAPTRVSRLALVNASGRGPSDDQQAAWAALAARLQDEPFERVAGEYARSTLPPARRSDATLIEAGEAMARRIGVDGLRRQLRAQQGRTSYLDELADLPMPVLVVSGALDDVCPPQRQQEIVEHCPHAELVSLADAGHMAPLEQPAAVSAALREWLRPAPRG